MGKRGMARIRVLTYVAMSFNTANKPLIVSPPQLYMYHYDSIFQDTSTHSSILPICKTLILSNPLYIPS